MIKEMNFSDFEKIAQTLTLHISIGELMLKTKEFANVNKISVEESNAIFLTAHEIVKDVTIRDFINTRDRRIKELEKFQIDKKVFLNMITITHFENKDSKHIKSFILRKDDDFICKVYWPKDSQTESRKLKFETAINQYIETKSEIPEYNYLVCWRKVRFNISLDFLDRYPTLFLKSDKMIDKFVKKIS